MASPRFGVRGARRSRRRRREPKARASTRQRRRVGSGMGSNAPPQPTRRSQRSLVSSPSGVRGGAPAAIAFSACFRPQKASGSKKNTIFLPKLRSIRKNWYFYMKICKFHSEKVVVTVTTTFKRAGDKSPPSHTKLRLWQFCRRWRHAQAWHVLLTQTIAANFYWLLCLLNK